MGFETKMLRAVSDVADGAYFYNGTLCIENISEDTAKVILSTLKKTALCDVKISNIVAYEPNRVVEFMYDFV